MLENIEHISCVSPIKETFQHTALFPYSLITSAKLKSKLESGNSMQIKYDARNKLHTTSLKQIWEILLKQD